MIRVVPLIVLVVFVAPHLAAGEDVVLLADYEVKDSRTLCEGGWADFETGDAAVGKGFLRWKVPGGEEAARVCTRIDETDLRPFGVLRLRYRLRGEFEGVVWVGLRSEKGSLEAAITEPSKEWRTLSISLAGMWKHMQLDPEKVRWIEFHTFHSKGIELDIDEIELLRTKGGWRGAGAGEEGFTYHVANFEGGAASEFEAVEGCRSEVVESGDGHALRLTPEGRHAYLSIGFSNVPEDIRPFRMVRLRARMVWGSGRGIEFYIFSQGGTLERELPALTDEWTTIEIPIPEMEMDETFNPQTVTGIRIMSFSEAKRVVEIDDLEMVVSGTGWRYSAKELIERGLQEFAPVKHVADFEAPDAAGRVELEGGEVERVPVKRKRGNDTRFALKWTVPEEGGKAWIVLRQIPRDLSAYRILRFVARADRKTDADVQIRLESLSDSFHSSFGSSLGMFSGGGSLAFDVEGFDRNWKSYELLLPDAHRLGSFNSACVTGMRFSRTGPLTVYLDRIELVKGGGGCVHTDRENVVARFGKKRAGAVKEVTTKHFRVFTDVEKPERKLGKNLEAIFTRAKSELDLPEPIGPIYVYIHREKEAWADPLLKKSWTVQQIDAVAGLARDGSLSTWHQDVRAEAFVHETVRAIIQRSAGGGGGDWLQQGAAAYVAARFVGKSPAEVYRASVKKRNRRPLVDLLVHPRLPADQRPMAAAFMEFLYRGPRSKQTVHALTTLVLLDPRAPACLDAVEETLGASVADLEQEFGAWLDGEK